MATIPQKELRDNVGEVLRRAEAGEELTITVSGRPVASLVPMVRDRRVGGPALGQIVATPAPQSRDGDLERFPGALTDPFE